jgi:hypothetical protein
MDGVVFTKTMFGIDELQRRQMRLHPRLRTLLVMVDGKKTGIQLIRTLATAGVTEAHLQQLQEAGLIQPVRATGESAAEPGKAVAATLISIPPEQVPADELSRFMNLQRIFSEAIDETYGKKSGFYLQKLEAVERIRDYIVLGNEIITTLNRSARVDKAVAFKARIKPFLR